MNETTAAYIAGIIDGEGYLYFQKQGPNRGRDRPQLEVSSVTPELILWLHATAGGFMPKPIDHAAAGRPNRQMEYRWRINGRACQRLIVACAPFLKINKKKDIAQKIIEW